MVASRESLLTASAVKLYGRVIAGLSVNVANARDELGANRFLREQLEAGEPQLARIYGFSYHGSYSALSRPAIFLVHGDGVPANGGASSTHQALDLTGKAYDCCEFADGIMVWEYDRGDFSLRLDIDSGPLERILIDAEERSEGPAYFRESKTRLRGPGE